MRFFKRFYQSFARPFYIAFIKPVWAVIRVNYFYLVLLVVPMATFAILNQAGIIDSYSLVLWLLVYGAFYHPLVISEWRKMTSRQKAAKVLLEHHKSMLAARIEMEEITYRRISREIHDNLRQLLVVAKLHLTSLYQYDQAEWEPKINMSIDMITKAYAELGDLSRSLHAEVIRRDGLVAAIDKELDKLRNTKLFETSLTVEGEDHPINIERELMIYRIIQEALSNIIKHAAAKNVTISVIYGPAALDITIRDDGKGFEPPPAGKESGGDGLKNMKLRTAFLEAKYKVISAPGKGTTINLSVPYDK
jgi:two-component system NarL family sensor kinase